MRERDLTPALCLEKLTQEQLSERLKICGRQVRNLTNRGMPRLSDAKVRNRHGLYPWPAVLKWYEAFKQEEAENRAAKYQARRERTIARRVPDRATAAGANRKP